MGHPQYRDAMWLRKLVQEDNRGETCSIVRQCEFLCWLCTRKPNMAWVQTIWRAISPHMSLLIFWGGLFFQIHHFSRLLWWGHEKGPSRWLLSIFWMLYSGKPGWPPTSCSSIVRQRPFFSGRFLSNVGIFRMSYLLNLVIKKHFKAILKCF